MEQDSTVQLPMPGMLRERGWSQAEVNLTVRCLMHLERIAWPQANVLDGYAIMGRLIEDGSVTVLERVRDTATWETLPARRTVAIGHPI